MRESRETPKLNSRPGDREGKKKNLRHKMNVSEFKISRGKAFNNRASAYHIQSSD